MLTVVVSILFSSARGWVTVGKYIFMRNTDVEKAEEELAKYMIMEEYCGKRNVSKTRGGFTCYNWRRVSYKQE